MKKTFLEQIQEKYIQENLNEIAEEIKRKISDEETFNEKTYEQGIADAWEVAKKIILSYKDYSTLKPTDFQAVFGTVDMSEVFEKFTAAEAIAKIKEHEEKQIINVGDEVYFISECKGVLICKDDSSYTILWDDESVIVYDKQKHRAIELKKTGRHFPQVAEMLKAMRE